MNTPPPPLRAPARMPSGLNWKRFVDLNAEESEKVLHWRNHPQVRKWMLNQEPITEHEHSAFLEKLRQGDDPDYYLLFFQQQAFGVVDFYRKSSNPHSCYYGYYLDPCRLGSAMGILLEFWVAEYALTHWQYHHIVAETRTDNTAARELHAHFGFSVMGTNSRELEEAVLHADTWKQRRKPVLSEIERFFCRP